MAGINKRKVERFDLEIPARLKMESHLENKPLELITKDVSSGGAFFQTSRPAPVGTEVEVDLIIPIDQLKKIDADRVQIKVEGAVIRSDGDGMVVSFKKNYKIAPVKN